MKTLIDILGRIFDKADDADSPVSIITIIVCGTMALLGAITALIYAIVTYPIVSAGILAILAAIALGYGLYSLSRIVYKVLAEVAGEKITARINNAGREA